MIVDSFFVTAPTGTIMNNPMIRFLMSENLFFYSTQKGPIIRNPLITLLVHSLLDFLCDDLPIHHDITKRHILKIHQYP